MTRRDESGLQATLKDQTAVTEQRVPERSRFRIPHASGALAARGDESAVRTPGHPPGTRTRATVGPRERERFLAGASRRTRRPRLPGHHPATATRLPSGLRAVSIAPGTRSSRPPGRWTDPGPGPIRPSSQAAATSDPSALNDGPHARPAPTGSRGAARRGVPHLQLSVLPGGGEPRAIRAERDVVHVPVVSLEREDALARLRVPDVDQARVLGALGHEDPSGLQARRPPTPGTSKSSRDATTARWSASSASRRAVPSAERVVSTASMASRTLSSGSTSRFATEAAASSRAWRSWPPALPCRADPWPRR